MLLIILALIFLSVTFLSIAFSFSVRSEEEKKREELKNRLRYLGQNKKTSTEKSAESVGIDLRTLSGLLKPFVPENIAVKIEDQLAKCDLPLHVSEFITISAISIGVLTLFGLILTRDIGVSILFMFVGFLLPYFFLKRAYSKKLKQFDVLLTDAITMMANTIKSGFGLNQSIKMVADEMPAPISTEFKKIVQEVTWGLTLEDALNNLNKRIGSEDLDLVVTSILVQAEIGGNLSEILEKIAKTIRERKQIKGEINSLTAQGKVSGVIVGALPIVIGGMIFVINPDYMYNLFRHPMGLAVLGAAVFLEVLGALVIKKIIALDV